MAFNGANIATSALALSARPRTERIQTSESDVLRHQILTSKGGPCTEKIKTFTEAFDQIYTMRKKSNEDIYDDFQLRKKPLVSMFYTEIYHCKA